MLVTYPLANLLHRIPCVCFAECMLAEENCLGNAVVEAYSGVLPVANMVAKAYIENRVSEVVAVEEEPESVYHTIALRHYDEHCRRITSSANDLLPFESAAILQ